MQVAAPHEGVVVGLSLSADHEYMACAVPESPNVPLWKLERPPRDSELAAGVAVHASRCSRWRDTPRPYRAAKRHRWDIDESNDAAGAVRQVIESVVDAIVAGELPELTEAPAEIEGDRADAIEFSLSAYGAIEPTKFQGARGVT